MVTTNRKQDIPYPVEVRGGLTLMSDGSIRRTRDLKRGKHGDSHPSGKHYKKLQQYVRNTDLIIGVDGEGETDHCSNYPHCEDMDYGGDCDCRHRYTLLAAQSGRGSQGYTIPHIGSNELTTVQCLNFLLSLPETAVKVGFSFGYDVNMILRDVPVNILAKLHKPEPKSRGYAYWEGYKLKYIPRKMFYVSDGDTSCTVFDTFGYFQMSFVKALTDWKVGTEEVVQAISTMKDLRGTFVGEMADRVREYCLQECLLLTDMIRLLFEAMLEARIYPSKYSGAGTIATYMLSEHEIAEYISRDPVAEEWGKRAYYGGRFDMSKAGHFPSVHSYDINSAYPHQCTQLPCLVHGHWEHIQVTEPHIHTEYDPDLPYTMWKVAWSILPYHDVEWPPFPWRQKDGNIYYTHQGKGTYWNEEVREGKRLIEHYGGKLFVYEGLRWVPECDHKPFSPWLEELYELRRRYKSEGNAAEKPLKLGYNSFYGKLAQTVGWQIEEDGSISPPPYQTWIWAGMITSGTRAMILSAINQDPASVISVATDSVACLHELRLPVGDGLGQWSHDDAGEELWLIMPGLYWFPNKKNKKGQVVGETKTRGHVAKELDWKKVVASWKRLQWLSDPTVQYPYTTTRFIGMGAALQRTEFARWWRRWVRIRLGIRFYPSRRVIPFSTKADAKRNGFVEWRPHPNKGREESTPYKQKEDWSEQWEHARLMKLLDSENP